MCNCGTETETTEHFFLRCPFFVTERQKLFNNVYDKHFSSQIWTRNLWQIFFYKDMIISMNVTTKKFLFIQLIMLNLLNVLNDHLLTNNYSEYISLLFYYLFLSAFFVFLLPLFSIVTFPPVETSIWPFITFLESLLPFQISSEDNKLCNSNNYSYKLVYYLFLQLAYEISMIFMCSTSP